MRRRSLSGLQLAVRAAVGASVSYALAQLLGLDHPIFAFTAAVIVTDLKPAQSRELGLRRLGATLVGGVAGAALSMVLPSTPWAIGAGVLGAMLLCDMLGARDGAKIAGYICGLIVLEHNAEPWNDAFYRMIETALGVMVAWAIAYVPKLIPPEQGDEGEATSETAPAPHEPSSTRKVNTPRRD
jgi:uncharacterized membrane protein YgaE (UPF0421/DUF939 family)